MSGILIFSILFYFFFNGDLTILYWVATVSFKSTLLKSSTELLT